MVMCFVPDCRHYSERDRCSFYRFPAKENDRKRWEELISRTDKRPSKYSLVCSCHFSGGLKANGPTIFMSFSQANEPPPPKKRKDLTDHLRSHLEISVPTSSQDETTLSAQDELNSPASSPKSLSSISEILETQLYYFDDDVSQNDTEPIIRQAPIKRFDITRAPKPPVVSVVLHEGQKYVMDNNAPSHLQPKPTLIESNINTSNNFSVKPPAPLIGNIVPAKILPFLPVETVLKELPSTINVVPQVNPILFQNAVNVPNHVVQRIQIPEPLVINRGPSSLQISEERSQSENKSLPRVPPMTNALLEAQLYFLEEDVKKLKTENEYLKARFCYASIADSDELVIMYTGLPNAEVFQLLLSFCTSFDFGYYYDWKVEKIKMEDQLLMTLMKLRRNESHTDLKVRFNCSVGMVANIILTWLHLLHEVLFLGLMRRIPSILKNRSCLPSCFSDFSACRMALEMTEIRCTDSKQKFKNNHVTHSHFKHGVILKGLVGVAPSGVVTFCSKLYPSLAANEEIFKDSGLVEIFQEGDLLLCEKGFAIGHLLPNGVFFNTPPSVSMPELSANQILQARSITRSRIHVERAICRIKGFAVLDLIPQMLRPYAGQVWQVCAALTNLQHPLIKEIESFY